MKHIKMMILEQCPYCKEAIRLMGELIAENEKYRQLSIEIIDEQKEEEKTQGYDYWYVPTYFVGNIKMHEGVATKEMIQAVFEEALS